MKRWMAGVACVVWVTGAVARPEDGAGEKRALSSVTLEQIMADPDWIARSPERAYWADDGTGVYFLRKRAGSEARDLWRVDVHLEGQGTGARYVADEARQLSDEERVRADVRFGVWSKDRQWKLFARDGDIILKNIEVGSETALTRTAASEFGARFMVGDRRVIFQRDGVVLVRDLESGLEYQPVDVRFEKEPEENAEKKKDFLTEQQERLFDTVKKTKERREEAKKRDKEEKRAREVLTPPTVYLGDDLELREASLSPSGEWMIVRAAKKGREGKRETMAAYVTEDGSVRASPVRGTVATAERRADELYLIDLREGVKERKARIDLAALPGIKDDPLSALKEEAKKRRGGEEEVAKEEKPPEEGVAADAPRRGRAREGGEGATGQGARRGRPRATEQVAVGDAGGGGEAPRRERGKPKDPGLRGVSVRDIRWSDDGTRAVVQVYAVDNKDRWIAAVELEERALEPLDRLHDDAWVMGGFSDMGWLEDNETIWYVSEETGYAQLYTLSVAGHFAGEEKKRRVTGWSDLDAHAEVSDVTLSLDGQQLFYRANAGRPGVHELYMVYLGAEQATPQQLTFMGGENTFELSPDERGVVILHSDTVTPPELYVQPTLLVRSTNDVKATRASRTVEAGYEGVKWIEPEVVAVPGREGRRVWARVYEKKSDEATERRSDGVRGEGRRPAVVFVHGAGYLQDAHEGWSHYFREHLFHNLLAARGYVVIAPDYRASAGYGRDWRTAIYRQMGGPEMEDVEDCIAWLEKEKNVDRTRVGIYGGSYGGFLTLMGLFTKPDLFACGAALRPVTDWAHYNDGYTANILNTPEVDPGAYEKSSPIEYAAGLSKPLLICHGMVDDNVFFQDTVRLAQRLIELKKENWEVAMYPVESHGFREETSWLDEYRRIDRLFRRWLEDPGAERSPSAQR